MSWNILLKWLYISSACVVVNFYWSELDTLSGFTILWIFLDIGESGFNAFGTLSICWSREYSCANSLNISRQTFSVSEYKKDSRTRTFHVIEH